MHLVDSPMARTQQQRPQVAHGPRGIQALVGGISCLHSHLIEEDRTLLKAAVDGFPCRVRLLCPPGHHSLQHLVTHPPSPESPNCSVPSDPQTTVTAANPYIVCLAARLRYCPRLILGCSCKTLTKSNFGEEERVHLAGISQSAREVNAGTLENHCFLVRSPELAQSASLCIPEAPVKG